MYYVEGQIVQNVSITIAFASPNALKGLSLLNWYFQVNDVDIKDMKDKKKISNCYQNQDMEQYAFGEIKKTLNSWPNNKFKTYFLLV